jgi:hypothetical protein
MLLAQFLTKKCVFTPKKTFAISEKRCVCTRYKTFAISDKKMRFSTKENEKDAFSDKNKTDAFSEGSSFIKRGLGRYFVPALQ